MKIVALIARYLLALAFLVFGSNGFLHFIKQPPPGSEVAKQFFTALIASHYTVAIFGVQLVAGILFLFRRTTPLALVLIAPIIVNILLFHALMDPPGIAPGVVIAILWGLVFWQYRRAFDGILSFAGDAPRENAP